MLDAHIGQYRIDVPTFWAKTDIRMVDLGAKNTQAPPDKNGAVDKTPEPVGAFQ